jgi:hypothetical protein
MWHLVCFPIVLLAPCYAACVLLRPLCVCVANVLSVQAHAAQDSAEAAYAAKLSECVLAV